MTAYLTSSSPRKAFDRRAAAFSVLDGLRFRYGRAFECVMRDPKNEDHRLYLLKATRRYRLVTWVLMGLETAHRITAWRFALGVDRPRADRRAA